MRTFVWAAVLLAVLTLAQMILDALGSLLAEWTRATVENRLKKPAVRLPAAQGLCHRKGQAFGGVGVPADIGYGGGGKRPGEHPAGAGRDAGPAGGGRWGMLLYLQPAFVYVVLRPGWRCWR